MQNLMKIVAIGMIAVAMLAGANTPVCSAEDKLAISIWGGSYAERFKEHVVKGFEAKYNVRVVVEGGRSSERLSKLIATKGRGIDLFYITDNQMLEAKRRGVLQPVNADNIPNMNLLYDFARDPLGDSIGPAFTILGVGLAYNRDHFSAPPDSWTDLKHQDLKAGVAYPGMGVSYGPMMLILMAEMNGGGIDNVDPGFKTLQEMKGRLQFFKRSGPTLKSINQGDVSIAPVLNIFARKDPSAPLRFTWPKEGGIGVRNMACVVKGTKNAALAEKFINYHLSTPVQEAMLRKQGETPVNVKVEVPNDLPFTILEKSDIRRLHFWDLVKIADARANWISRWQEEVVAE